MRYDTQPLRSPARPRLGRPDDRLPDLQTLPWLASSDWMATTAYWPCRVPARHERLAGWPRAVPRAPVIPTALVARTDRCRLTTHARPGSVLSPASPAAGNRQQHLAQLVPRVRAACLDAVGCGREREEPSTFVDLRIHVEIQVNIPACA